LFSFDREKLGKLSQITVIGSTSRSGYLVDHNSFVIAAAVINPASVP